MGRFPESNAGFSRGARGEREAPGVEAASADSANQDCRMKRADMNTRPAHNAGRPIPRGPGRRPLTRNPSHPGGRARKIYPKVRLIAFGRDPRFAILSAQHDVVMKAEVR